MIHVPHSKNMYLMYLIEVQNEVQSEVQIKNNDSDFHLIFEI